MMTTVLIMILAFFCASGLVIGGILWSFLSVPFIILIGTQRNFSLPHALILAVILGLIDDATNVRIGPHIVLFVLTVVFVRILMQYMSRSHRALIRISTALVASTAFYILTLCIGFLQFGVTRYFQVLSIQRSIATFVITSIAIGMIDSFARSPEVLRARKSI